MDDPWEDVARAGEWLLSLETEVAPDVVHLNGYCHAALPFYAPAVVVGHSCVLSWYEAVKHSPAPAGYERYQAAVSRGLHAAALVVTPTNYMLDALQRHYGTLTNARVIRKARDADRFRPGAKEPFVLAAGRLWDEAKNLRVLHAAASRLSWPVHIAGFAAHPDGRDATASNVHLLGAMAPRNLAAEMARASIYALPAVYEPFGLSILEAALSGCALVLGDIASLRELWSGCAVFVEPDDSRSLTAALQQLIDAPSVRAELASRALARAARLTPARMTDDYLRAYAAVHPAAKVA
jgi:glycosyltransferase involved in cell wall biosynthesis